MRARTSPLRFVSCVVVASRCRGKRAARSRFARWKSSTGSEKRPGSPPTSFSATQPELAVERRVLDALGHHRPGRLLEARHERVVPALLEQQDRARRLGGQARAPRGRSARRPRPTTARRRCGRRGATASARCERPASTELAASRASSGANVVARLLELRLVRDLGERPRLARQLLVQRGSAAPRRRGRRTAP